MTHDRPRLDPLFRGDAAVEYLHQDVGAALAVHDEQLVPATLRGTELRESGKLLADELALFLVVVVWHYEIVSTIAESRLAISWSRSAAACW